MAQSGKQYLLVVAIDFGTTFSGWAFSFYHNYKSDPAKVSTKRWTGAQYISLKGPTSILLHPDGSTIKSFGFDAENEYCDLEDRDQYYFFRRFKMLLHGIKTINKNTMLKDASGKKLPAIQVFAKSIEYLKTDILDDADKQMTGQGLQEDDVRWVLTVPAIWDDSAKQFMRKCAVNAGINEENLLLALEPEVASLFCRYLSSRNLLGDTAERIALDEGTVYIVVDAGGGTVDVTMHEVLKDGFLKELYKASGGAWGGTEVDKYFVKCLEGILGKEVVDKWERNDHDNFLDVMRDFESLKRSIDGNRPTDLKIRVSVPMLDELTEEEYGKSLKTILQKSPLGDKVSIKRDKLIVANDIYKGFFEPSLDSIKTHLRSILDQPVASRCSVLVLVGGFSECKLLQQELRTCFPNMKFIVPNEAGLAVMTGAVIFGHNPSFISERVSRFTYGTDFIPIFNPTKHPLSKKRTYEGKDYCSGVFDVIVRAGDVLKVGQKSPTTTYNPLLRYQSEIPLDIYATEEADVSYVTDEGCMKIGSVLVPLPPAPEGDDNRLVDVQMILGGTELHIECTIRETGEIVKGTVDFLG